jgi:methylglutaconyl-CoA hydratase
MTASAPIDIHRAHGIATVWLDRPAVRNAFDEALIAALTAAIGELSCDAAVRVIVLAGRGPAFCAGADLGWMARLAALAPQENHADAQRLARMFKAIDDCPKPTIARVHGACFAGGNGLVATCDMAVATVEARFCFSEARLGLVPATIGPYVLRAIGHRAASRYLLTAEVFDAPEARQIGLVSAVVAPDQLDATVDALAATLSAGGPEALATTKRLIRGLAGRAIDESLLLETARSIADVRASPEGREGMRAMLEKRPPSWHGTNRD